MFSQKPSWHKLTRTARRMTYSKFRLGKYIKGKSICVFHKPVIHKAKKKKRLCDEIIARGVYVGGEGKGEHGRVDKWTLSIIQSKRADLNVCCTGTSLSYNNRN